MMECLPKNIKFKLHRFLDNKPLNYYFFGKCFPFNFLILKLKDKVLFFNFKINRLL